MAGTEPRRPGRGGGGRAIAPAADFTQFSLARERFFACLRRDSEIRRLERLWALGPPAPGAPRRDDGGAGRG